MKRRRLHSSLLANRPGCHRVSYRQGNTSHEIIDKPCSLDKDRAPLLTREIFNLNLSRKEMCAEESPILSPLQTSRLHYTLPTE